jgi:hypothetical protein
MTDRSLQYYEVPPARVHVSSQNNISGEYSSMTKDALMNQPYSAKTKEALMNQPSSSKTQEALMNQPYSSKTKDGSTNQSYSSMTKEALTNQPERNSSYYGKKLDERKRSNDNFI